MQSINTKNLLYLVCGSLIFSGCTTTQGTSVPKEKATLMQKNTSLTQVSKPTSSWKQKDGLRVKVDDDCIDCYANPLVLQTEPEAPRTYYADVTKSIGPYVYRETEADRKVKSDYKAKSETYNSYSSFPDTPTSDSLAIQVGAFSKYTGAENYLKRYNKFSTEYQVKIITGTKNNKPIHRVQILGFKNSSEAKSFMRQNGLSDAFLVK